MEIKRTLLPPEKRKPLYQDPTQLQFGREFTDHMFTMEYGIPEGWKNPEIKPLSPLVLHPATVIFHYSQAAFEGQKAYKSPDNEILLFRPLENAGRMNESLRRMRMPEIPPDWFLEAECELLKLEERWIPKQKGTALYIRPAAIPTEVLIGPVVPSEEYLFFIILCPVGPFYREGFNPIGLMVETKYSRAAPGGTGEAKTGGNYAATMAASQTAREKGYSQVLWLDACEGRYVEEVGAMNIFFVIEDMLVTPPLTGSILPGITRKSVLELAADLGIEPDERQITIDELIEGLEAGRITEVFGTGTAAVISPVGRINYEDREVIVHHNTTGYWARTFFETLTGIQYGELDDPYGWVYRVD